MSVIVHGMNMPKGCGDCYLFSYCYDSMDKYEKIPDFLRACPLEEVKLEKPVDLVGIGDICKYKNDEKELPFIVTNIYRDKNSFGESDFFFAALRFDGSVINDGTLSLIERVGKRTYLRELNVFFEIIKGG